MVVLSPEQQAFVREPRIAVLATVDPGGGPHAAPMWYALDGSQIVMVTRRGSQKHRNLQRLAKATVVIDRRSRPYFALMIACRVSFADHQVDLVRSRVAARYLSEPELSTYLDSRRGGDAVVIQLEPTDIAVYGSP